MSDTSSQKAKRLERKAPGRSPFHSAISSEITPAPSNSVHRPQQPTNLDRLGRRGQLAPPSMPAVPASGTRSGSLLANPLDRAISAPPFDAALAAAVTDQKLITPLRAAPIEREEACTMKTISESMGEMSVESRKVKALLEQDPAVNLRDSPQIMAQVQRALAAVTKADEKIAACTKSLESANAEPEIRTRRRIDNAGGSKQQLKTNSATISQEKASSIKTTATRSAGPASKR